VCTGQLERAAHVISRFRRCFTTRWTSFTTCMRAGAPRLCSARAASQRTYQRAAKQRQLASRWPRPRLCRRIQRERASAWTRRIWGVAKFEGRVCWEGTCNKVTRGVGAVWLAWAVTVGDKLGARKRKRQQLHARGSSRAGAVSWRVARLLVEAPEHRHVTYQWLIIRL